MNADTLSHPLALNEAAERRMMARDWTGARGELERAIRVDASLPVLWVNLAAVFYNLNRPADEKAALDKALSLDPRNLRALLQAGVYHENRDESRAAAAIYRTALQSVPRGAQLPQAMTAHLQHAVKVVEANSRALEDFLDERLRAVRARHPDQSLRRFDICMAIALQKQPIYRSRPTFLYFPELPTIEFHDRAQFAWLDQIEAATDEIRAEFQRVYVEDAEHLEPYVRDVSEGDIWRELSNSPRWSIYNLWKNGAECAENLARCPRTAEALKAWPKTDLRGSGPSAVFSILDAKTRIPSHVGVHNSRLIVHLPLVVPPDCWFRVGSTTREWEEGKAMIFDDSIEHEAWNGSDVPRAVLIFDIWNPQVTEAERDLVSALTDGIGAFYGSLPSYV